MSDKLTQDLEGVAVVGMTGRFPGADDLEQFWENLTRGIESISHFGEDELEPSRVESASARRLPHYVRARGILADVDKFDAAFFGISPREAAIMDPQHRLFLEGVWSALESAGYDPAQTKGSIGIWAGMNNSTYFLENVLSRPDILEQVGSFQAMLGNDRDYLATRASYKLNLRGPSVTVQTACSTALVAVNHAFQALVGLQCDMAVAGAVSITLPQRAGYLYQSGGILSVDGHCRPFDADAAGTVFSSGMGLVVLKRVEDALEDRDFIHAVIRGGALNNDGADKVSFSAPSVNGQAEAITLAQELAGVEPETIGYVETHGTATPLGDPIEIAALTQAFRSKTDAKQFCALGSVKSNIGHLDAAAGAAGLIKTVLSLRHRKLVPSLHYRKANPHIDFESSPFYVNTTCQPWPKGSTPRRAGVSSFGVGGTNAHLVLEEAPDGVPCAPARREQLLLLSAKSEPALDRATARLARHFRFHPDVNLADTAYTLQIGRRGFSCRRALVSQSTADAAEVLESKSSARLLAGRLARPVTKVAFLFPGQGAQYAGMAAELHTSEPEFAHEFDACARVLNPRLGLDIHSLVFSGPADREKAEARLAETAITQPVLFAVELALARLWMSWGIEPAAMIGHSLGEFVAACLAGVMDREQAALVVAERGRLMQEQPRGAMLAVRASLEALQPWLDAEVTVAGANAPELNVVSGPEQAIKALEQKLTEKKIGSRVLATSHAFHSAMMEGALPPFRRLLQGISLQRPQRPWVSGLTGDWVTAEQATDPEYWVAQMRQPVQFSKGIQLLSQDPELAFLEVGPGRGLSTLVRAHRHRPPEQPVVVSLQRDVGGDETSLLQALGTLWIAGLSPNWNAVHGGQPRRRVDLPTYAFEKERHWIEAVPGSLFSSEGEARQVPISSEPRPPSEELGESGRGQAKETVLERLRSLLSQASGHRPEAIVSSQSFLELGFDSLLLTQVAAAIQKDFGVGLSLRQFVEHLTNLDLLAKHLESELNSGAGSSVDAQANNLRASPGEAVPDAPPIPGARLGKDAQGRSCWFVPDPNRPGKYLQVKPHDKAGSQ